MTDEVKNDGGGGTAMEELRGNLSSSVLSDAIVTNLKNSGIFRFNRRREGFMRRCISETFEEMVANPRSQTEGVGTAEEQGSTLPPLVLQFDNPAHECVTMAMMKNGIAKVVKNEKGAFSTPAFAGFIDGKGLVYGMDSKGYRGPREVWRCIDFWRTNFPKQANQSIDLGEHGIYNLSRQFFTAYLIRKLKMSAEARCDGGGLCQVAILAVPMRIKCAQRLRLKEAAVLAGFKDVYAFSAEGLAAYYWFKTWNREIEEKGYSRSFVIIDLFGHAVIYKKSLELDTDGVTSILIVKAFILLDLDTLRTKEEDSFRKMVQKRLFDEMEGVIPVIARKGGLEGKCYLGSKYEDKIVIVEDDQKDPFKFFAAKGAALLSESPEKIGRQVHNMIGATIRVDPDNAVTIPFRVLPDNCLKLALKITHDRAKYRITQIGVGRRFSDCEEVIGYLAINGVQYGTELEVTYELSSESTWKVVGVCAKSQAGDEDDDEGVYNEVVKWGWVNEEQAGFGSHGCSSYEECKDLLMKVAPSPSQAQVASRRPRGNDSSGDLMNIRDEAGSGAAATTSSGKRIGRMVKKKLSKKKKLKKLRAERKERYDRRNEARSKKVKLESGQVDVVAKTEEDWNDDQEEDEDEEGSDVTMETQEDIEQSGTRMRRRLRIFTQKITMH